MYETCETYEEFLFEFVKSIGHSGKEFVGVKPSKIFEGQPGIFYINWKGKECEHPTQETTLEELKKQFRNMKLKELLDDNTL